MSDGLVNGTGDPSNYHPKIGEYIRNYPIEFKTTQKDFFSMVRLYTKLMNVMSNIGWISKGQTVNVGGGISYDYTSEAQFIAEVRPLFIEQKLIIAPVDCTDLSVTQFDKGNGKVSYLTTMKVTYLIADSESGESMTVVGLGQGVDSGDKGIYKAMTGALKYALRQALFIGTGDDPERYDEDGKVVEKANGKAESQENRGTRMVLDILKNLSQENIAIVDKVLSTRGWSTKTLPNEVDNLRKVYIFVSKLSKGEDVEKLAVEFNE